MDIFHSKIYLLAVLLSHVYISRLFCLLGSIFFSQDASYFIKYHLIYERVRFSSSSETKGQSVGSGEKAERKFSSAGERAPGYRLSPSYVQNFKRMPDPNWAQKLLCIVVPNRRTVSPKFFSWVRTRRLFFRSRLVWLMHQRNARSQETFSLI